jgi:hypothetical protein
MTESDLLSRIAAVRRTAGERRAAAWAAVPETVLGLDCRPITPATFDLLQGTRNAFVCGLPPVLADVRNFLLYHSPDFDPDAPTPRFWPRFRHDLRVSRALCPAFTPPRRREAVRATRFFQAVQEIRAIVAATWADALPANDDGADPLASGIAASLHAQLADMFARDYATWPMATPLRHTPLAQLFQLARCSERHHLGRSATYFDAAENAAMRDFLIAANASALNPAPTPTPSHG